jgi:CRP-like cAMP-binding protein
MNEEKQVDHYAELPGTTTFQLERPEIQFEGKQANPLVSAFGSNEGKDTAANKNPIDFPQPQSRARMSAVDSNFRRQLSNRRNAKLPHQHPTLEAIKADEKADVGSAVNSRWTIDPDGPFKQGWETFNLVCLMFTFAYVPIRMSFLFKSEVPIAVYSIEKVIDVFFFCDLLLAFFTPTIVGFETAYKHRAIAKEYFKLWFWMDLITILPIGDIIDGYFPETDDPAIKTKSNIARFALFTKAIRILRLLKFFRAFRLQKKSKNYLKSALKWFFGDNFVMDFVNSLAVIIITIHISACFWYFVAVTQPSNISWLTLGNFQDQGLLDKYAVSIYFAVQTFTTVGYGDIPSQTDYERIIRICMMCAGTLVYSIFTGEITDYQSKMTAKAETYALKMQRLDSVSHRFLDADNQSHQKLILKIRREFEHQRDDDYEDDLDFNFEKLDLQNLNDADKDQFHFMMFQKKFSKVPLLREFTESSDCRPFFVELGKSIKNRTYEKDEIFYSAGEPTEYFYILLSGVVQVCFTGTEEVPIFETRSGFFGEYELIVDEFLEKNGSRDDIDILSPQLARNFEAGDTPSDLESSGLLLRRQYTVKAKTPCKVLMIDKKMFSQMLANHPNKSLVDQFKRQAISRQNQINKSYNAISQKLEKYIDDLYRKLEDARKFSDQKAKIEYPEGRFKFNVKKVKEFFRRTKKLPRLIFDPDASPRHNASLISIKPFGFGAMDKSNLNFYEKETRSPVIEESSVTKNAPTDIREASKAYDPEASDHEYESPNLTNAHNHRQVRTFEHAQPVEEVPVALVTQIPPPLNRKASVKLKKPPPKSRGKSLKPRHSEYNPIDFDKD